MPLLLILKQVGSYIKKLAPYAKYIIFSAAIVILLFVWWGERKTRTNLQKELDTYKRQVSGQLTEKEKQLEAQNNELGLAKSKLMDQDALVKAFQDDNIKVGKQFQDFKSKYNIEIESYNKTIAQLKQEIHNTNSTVITTSNSTSSDPKPDTQFNHLIDPLKEKLSYQWKSGDGRFELYDPNVFSSNEPKIFKLNQNFRITGEIYREKAGFLKTQRLTLEEVVYDGTNKDGTPKYKSIGTASIVDSKFNYSERSPEEFMPRGRWYGAWGIIGLNYSIKNLNTQSFTVSTGVRFLQWPSVGLGLNTQLFLDTRTFSDSGWGLGIDYRPTVKGTKLNVGVGFSVYTPFNANIGKDYFYNLGILLYLW